jgi:hypothetical protein
MSELLQQTITYPIKAQLSNRDATAAAEAVASLCYLMNPDIYAELARGSDRKAC